MPGASPSSPLGQTSGASPGPATGQPSRRKRALYVVGFLAWVFLGFMLAQALVLATIWGLGQLGVSFAIINETVFNAAGSAVIYALSIILIIGAPWLIKKRKTSRQEVGLNVLPRWIDFLWTPAGMIIYLILTSLVTALATYLLPFIDYNQAQETGYSQIATRPEYFLAFISLVIIAPIAEEVLFRGYLLAKLKKYAPVWLAVLLTSLLFGIVHFQWNVGIDVFVLSLVLCFLRLVSGSLWPSIMLHMLKNGIAFYFLFVNPALLNILGG